MRFNFRNARWPPILFSPQQKLILCVIAGASVLLIYNFSSWEDSSFLSLKKKTDDHLYVEATTLNISHHSRCTSCVSGKPCEYKDTVNIRIMVLAYNRPESLRQCLENFHRLKSDGDTVAIEIWIDKRKDGLVHKPTVEVATAFSASWQLGVACVHIQTAHAFIAQQWMYSWRPAPHSGEMALIVEDDIDVSPYAYRWLKAMNRTYGADPSTFGYSLQMENVLAQTDGREPLQTDPSHTIFRNAIFGTWGFSPKGDFWREFQDWHLRERSIDKSFKPYWNGVMANNWFKSFEQSGKEESMAHEMWIIRYTLGHKDKMYCVYSNLVNHLNKTNVLLASHRAEAGLHYSKAEKSGWESMNMLLKEWDPSFVNIPQNVVSFDAHGNVVRIFDEN